MTNKYEPTGISYFPKPALQPWRGTNWQYTWPNGYTGVGGTIVDTTNKIVHAFFHAEDWYSSPPTQNHNPMWEYARVGYARSPASYPDYYTLNYQAAYGDNDGGCTGASPAIEAYQPESACVFLATGTVRGTGSPCVIKKNNDLYMLYTRYTERNYSMNLPSPAPALIYADTMTNNACVCLAKAAYSAVLSSTYSSSPNPWYKYYNGGFAQAGRGGYDTPVVRDVPAQYNPRVVCNVLYNADVGQYILLTYKPDGNTQPTPAAYLYVSSDLVNWGNGIWINFYPQTDFRVQRLVGDGGSDQYSSAGWNNKIYGHNVYNNDNTIFSNRRSEPTWGPLYRSATAESQWYGMVRYDFDYY